MCPLAENRENRWSTRGREANDIHSEVKTGNWSEWWECSCGDAGDRTGDSNGDGSIKRAGWSQ